MTKDTWREEFYRKCDLRIEKGGFTYLYERDDTLNHESIANFIQQEIDIALDTQKREIVEAIDSCGGYYRNKFIDNPQAEDVIEMLDKQQILEAINNLK